MEIVLILILLIIILTLFSITIILSSKNKKKIRSLMNELRVYKEKALSFEKNELLKGILTASFEKKHIEAAGDKIIDTFRSYYKMAYCSLFVLSDGQLRLISSNADEEYLSKIEDYSNVLYESILKEGVAAKIQYSDGTLTYPSASERYIKYCYFIPLRYEGKTIGGIQFEHTNKRIMDNLDEELFNVVMDHTALVLLNLISDDKLLFAAHFDGLTKVYNRKYMEEFIDKQVHVHSNTKEPFSIAIFDIDHFKRFNDTYGHQVGDEVLRVVSRLVKDFLRKSGDTVFRYGGEEFVIFFKGATNSEVENRLNQLRVDISQYNLPTGRGDEHTNITASFGLAEFPKNGTDKATLIKLADQALYYSKKNGRNQVSVYNRIKNKLND